MVQHIELSNMVNVVTTIVLFGRLLHQLHLNHPPSEQTRDIFSITFISLPLLHLSLCGLPKEQATGRQLIFNGGFLCHECKARFVFCKTNASALALYIIPLALSRKYFPTPAYGQATELKATAVDTRITNLASFASTLPL